MAKKVLIAEDEDHIRMAARMAIDVEGYEIFEARDGQEALEVARRVKPDLIILDVMMPKESGVSMYRELKLDSSLKEIPVIMLSALSKKTFFHSQRILDEYKGEKIPEPTAYIEKPPEPDDLLEVIRRSLK